jgi:hypothetical protein
MRIQSPNDAAPGPPSPLAALSPRLTCPSRSLARGPTPQPSFSFYLRRWFECADGPVGRLRTRMAAGASRCRAGQLPSSSRKLQHKAAGRHRLPQSLRGPPGRARDGSVTLGPARTGLRVTVRPGRPPSHLTVSSPAGEAECPLPESRPHGSPKPHLPSPQTHPQTSDRLPRTRSAAGTPPPPSPPPKRRADPPPQTPTHRRYSAFRPVSPAIAGPNAAAPSSQMLLPLRRTGAHRAGAGGQVDVSAPASVSLCFCFSISLLLLLYCSVSLGFPIARSNARAQAIWH